ncbi:toll/interleukin-1 receptor domain-containing protein [Methanobrevibacter sp.]|uniref:toll/interleukin-1 receptor domain-containing protein n=1 Tax=Methanobrevibacter sp. TaxID=66852 RepID=UPI00386E3E21
MAHDVYLSYDEKDLDTALNVCETLESNGLKCWMKNRDVDSDNRVRSIIKAIKQSRLLLLVHSKNSKHSKFINNEVNEAFDADRSFLVYHIDDSELSDNLGFFLNAKPKINAYPNPEEKNDVLIRNAKNLVKKQRKEDRKISNIIKDNKKSVAIGIIALVVIVAVAGFMMFNGEGTSSAPVNVGDFKIQITDFNKEDVSKQDFDWNYSYSVVGSISPTPDKNSGLSIVVDFYDKTGKLVEEKETPFEDAQISGSGLLFGSVGSDKNDISYVDVQLVNSDDVIIAQDDSQI